MKKGNEMLDIVEFLRVARAFKNQIEILQKLKLPAEEKELAKNAVKQIIQVSSKYI